MEEEKFDEMIESWINGNRIHVCEQIRELDDGELIRWMKFFRSYETKYL